MATLPELLQAPGDRERLAALARALLGDERVQRSEEQLAMVDRIGTTLRGPGSRRAAGAGNGPARKAARKAQPAARARK
jgi:hypothetical protein